MKLVGRAIRLLLTKPALWPAAASPMVLSLLGYAVLLLMGFSWLVPQLVARLESWGWNSNLGYAAGSALFAIIWLVASGPVFLVLFGSLAVPCWDRLSLRTEEAVSGSAPTDRPGLRSVAFDLSFRLPLAVFVAFLALVLGLAGLPVLSALIGGLFVLVDTSAPACFRRKLDLFHQPAVIFRSKSWVGVWLVASATSAVPFLNMLVVPCFVVASTLLVLESEKRANEAVE